MTKNINEILFLISAQKKRAIKKIEIAKALEVSRQYISELFSRNAELTEEKIKLLEEKFQVDLSGSLSVEEQVVRVIIPKDSKIKVIVEYE